MSEIAFRITNSGEEDINPASGTLSDQYTISSGTSYRVEAARPEADVLELEYNEHKLVVYGSSGSVVSVSKIGQSIP